MMHASLWKQLQPWPKAYWDDWLREPPQRKGRQVIRPEISRTYHFGSKGGASYNQYSSHLDTILLNKQNVDWSQQDLSYLDKDTFTRKYNQDVASALLLYMDPDEWHETKIRDQIMDMLRQSSVKIEYNNWDDFVMLANMMNLMDNEKAGVPRTAFQGIVECRPHGPGGNILYLIPASS
jgi:alpha-1,3-mannosyl-glycoprotein beta-1,2-N-acetylglucosaminyltransferase